MQPRATEPGRMIFVDSLRGLAALAVVLFHLYGAVGQEFSNHGSAWVRTLPGPAHAVLSHGWLGVEVFFVLSGFVIAASIGGRAVTAQFAGNFLLRRAVRLDPAYWATIAGTVLISAVTFALFRSASAQLPSAGQLAAHLFYAQNLLGFGDLVPVFWTLCLEVQFYLAFILLIALAQRAGGGWRSRALVLAPLTGWSLAASAGVLPSPGSAWLVANWYLFALGVATWWALAKTLPQGVWAGFFLAALTVAISQADPAGLTGTLTCGLLYTAGRLGKLAVWLPYRWVQGLGRLSYSLYLAHVPATLATMAVLKRAFGTPTTAVGMVGTMAVLFAASLAASLALYYFVERPSVRLSQRLKRPLRVTLSSPLPRPLAVA